MPWDFALILIVLATAVPWLGRRRIRQLVLLPDTTSIERLLLYASTIAFQWIAVGVILWRALARHLKAAELGLVLPHPLQTVAIGIGLSCLLFANQLLSVRRLASHPAEAGQPLVRIALRIFPRNSIERLAFFALVATVAVCEEVIYRGFAQTALQHWLGGLVACGIVGSAAIFAAAHAYQGRRGLITTCIVGILFSIVRVFAGSIVPTIMAHVVADFSIGILAPRRRLKQLQP